MNILCHSDQHGVLPEYRETDILVLPGDLLPNLTLSEQLAWADDHLYEWLGNYPCGPIIFVPGNHDIAAAQSQDFLNKIEDCGVTVLIDEPVMIDEVLFHGSPWTTCPPAVRDKHNWQFWLPEEDLKKKWNQAEDAVQVLITHCPPYGILDCGGVADSLLNVGSSSLRDKTLSLKHLRYHVFGHEHFHGGMSVNLLGVQYINACGTYMEINI